MSTVGEVYSFYVSPAKSLLSLTLARFCTRSPSSRADIVTGANNGIGLLIAVALVKQGTAVHLACRNADRRAAVVDFIVAQCHENRKARVSCRILDVGDLSSVRAFCQQWTKDLTPIDILVHDTGSTAPLTRNSGETKEGLDIMYTTNFLGSFLMTFFLESPFSPTARVVLTSSTGSYPAAAHLLRENASGKLKTPPDPTSCADAGGRQGMSWHGG